MNLGFGFSRLRLLHLQAIVCFVALATTLAVPGAYAQTAAAAATAPIDAKPVTATGPRPTNQPTGTPCELHIWPSEHAHTTYFGWVHGGAVDGNRRGIKGYPNMYAEALDTAEQARLLAQVNWPVQTGEAGLQISVHATPTGTDDDRTRTTRLIAGSAACYRELIITSTIVENAAFSSQSVRVVALRKKFDGTTALPASFSSMSMAKVDVPEKTVPEFDAKMRTAVQAAFLEAIKKFAVIQSFH